MARKTSSKFVEEAKRIMDENIHMARFNETSRNIEKLKQNHINISCENSQLKGINIHLEELVCTLKENNRRLVEQVNFLEEILNSMQLLVSVKDINHRNMLWYNENYKRILGYRHKELQELNCEEAINRYHPEDRRIIEDRSKQVNQSAHNRYSCVLRLKHIDGSWLRMNSDYIVIKRNPDGTHSQALEILSAPQTA